MKICIAATSGVSLLNFRGRLISEWVRLGHEVCCLSIEPVTEMEDRIHALGASYYQTEGDRTGANVLAGIKMISWYKKMFQRLKPDICFLYMGKPIMFGGYAAYKCGVPHINILVNGLEMAFYSKGIRNYCLRTVLKRLYKTANKNADTVFFQNHDDYDYFIAHQLSNAKQSCIINGSGVDMDYFLREPLPDAPVILMVARLLWSKGIREYLAAVKAVRKKYPNVKVLLVGGLDTNSEALTQNELDSCIRGINIEYCGYIADVRPYLKRCSIFVLPSYHEGTPRCVLEAMATGRPIITTDAPGCRETVVNGYNGFLVPVKDSAILAEKMAILIENSDLRKRMAEHSYKLCCEKYNVIAVNQDINNKMGLLRGNV